MGVGLQIFLFLLVSSCVMGVYRVCIPMSWGYESSQGVMHAVGFGTCLALMVASYLKAWLSDPGTVEDSSWMQVAGPTSASRCVCPCSSERGWSR